MCKDCCPFQIKCKIWHKYVNMQLSKSQCEFQCSFIDLIFVFCLVFFIFWSSIKHCVAVPHTFPLPYLNNPASSSIFVTLCLCWWVPKGVIAVNGKYICTRLRSHMAQLPNRWPAPQFRELFFCGTASWLTGSSTWSCLPCKMHRWSARWLSSQCPLTASSGLEVHNPKELHPLVLPVSKSVSVSKVFGTFKATLYSGLCCWQLKLQQCYQVSPIHGGVWRWLGKPKILKLNGAVVKSVRGTEGTDLGSVASSVKTSLGLSWKCLREFTTVPSEVF